MTRAFLPFLMGSGVGPEQRIGTRWTSDADYPVQISLITSDRESSIKSIRAFTNEHRSGSIATGLPAGEHHLHCQLIEGKEFRIIALMT